MGDGSATPPREPQDDEHESTLERIVRMLPRYKGRDDDVGASFDAYTQSLVAAHFSSLPTERTKETSALLAKVLTLTCTGPAALVIRNVKDSSHGVEMYCLLREHFGVVAGPASAGMLIAKISSIKLKVFSSLGSFYAAFVRLVNLLTLALSSPVALELQRTWFLKAVCPGNAPTDFDPFYPVLSSNMDGDVAAMYSALKDYADLNDITFNRRPRQSDEKNDCFCICTTCGGLWHTADQCPSPPLRAAEACVWCTSPKHSTEACRTKREGWTIGTTRQNYTRKDQENRRQEQRRPPPEGVLVKRRASASLYAAAMGTGGQPGPFDRGAGRPDLAPPTDMAPPPPPTEMARDSFRPQAPPQAPPRAPDQQQYQYHQYQPTSTNKHHQSSP